MLQVSCAGKLVLAKRRLGGQRTIEGVAAQIESDKAGKAEVPAPSQWQLPADASMVQLEGFQAGKGALRPPIRWESSAQVGVVGQVENCEVGKD